MVLQQVKNRQGDRSVLGPWHFCHWTGEKYAWLNGQRAATEIRAVVPWPVRAMASQLIEQVDVHIASFCLNTQQEARSPLADRYLSCAERGRALRPSRLGKGVLCHSSKWVIRRKERPRASSERRLMLNEIWPYSHALSRRWASPCRRSPSAVACGLDLHLLLQAVAAS